MQESFVYFKNREHAGKMLLEKITSIQLDIHNTVVIALPRGGVPVALPVAQGLHLPLDIVLVKKIGVPSAPELAIGAVSEDGEVFYNKDLMQYFNYSESDMMPYKKVALDKLEVLGAELRGARTREKLENKDVIIVDDGIATGATIEVVLQLMQKKKVKKIIIATPVISPDVIQKLQNHVDKIISVIAPQFLSSIGEWYEDFDQVETKNVVKILNNYPKINESSTLGSNAS